MENKINIEEYRLTEEQLEEFRRRRMEGKTEAELKEMARQEEEEFCREAYEEEAKDYVESDWN